jgi:uncharacterized protein
MCFISNHFLRYAMCRMNGIRTGNGVSCCPVLASRLPERAVCRKKEFMTSSTPAFWRSKSLDEMTPSEWESLCDGCGRCCLVKLEDADDGTLYHTDVACRLFDGNTCFCQDYSHRSARVPDCVTLTPHEVRHLRWLPPSCAYRLVSEGQDLAWWHPLVSGTSQSVVDAGVSVKGRVFANEDQVSLAKLQSRIRQWPNRMPQKAIKNG